MPSQSHFTPPRQTDRKRVQNRLRVPAPLGRRIRIGNGERWRMNFKAWQKIKLRRGENGEEQLIDTKIKCKPSGWDSLVSLSDRLPQPLGLAGKRRGLFSVVQMCKTPIYTRAVKLCEYALHHLKLEILNIKKAFKNHSRLPSHHQAVWLLLAGKCFCP